MDVISFHRCLWIIAFIHATISAGCHDYSEQQYMSIPTPDTGLQQIHVRHNLKGSVHFKLKEDGERDVGVEVVKTGSSAGTVKYISINHTLFTPAPSVDLGNVLVIQVDRVEPDASLATVVISLIVVVLLALVAAGVATWLYRTRACRDKGQFRRVKTEDKRRAASPVTSTEVEEEEDDEGGFKSKAEGSRRRIPDPPPPPSRQQSPQNVNQQPNGKEMLPLGQGVSSPKHLLVSLSLVAALSVVCASCITEMQVTVILLIPPVLHIESVQAFFNEANGNKVKLDDWWKNYTQAQTFRIKGSPTTAKPPCKGNCDVAYAENLVGCDPRSTRCVCEEGYILRDSICVACSVGCPVGTFEAHPCTYTENRICQECSQCTGAMYEVKPCTGGSDRKCMHAAHPLTISQDAAEPKYLDELLWKKPQRRDRKSK